MTRDEYIMLYNKHKLCKDSLKEVGKNAIKNSKERLYIMDMDLTIIQELEKFAKENGVEDIDEFYHKLLFNI